MNVRYWCLKSLFPDNPLVCQTPFQNTLNLNVSQPERNTNDCSLFFEVIVEGSLYWKLSFRKLVFLESFHNITSELGVLQTHPSIKQINLLFS